MAQRTLLLINDVEHLGRSGDVVRVRPGYARNYLVPKNLGVVATKQTLRMQEKLQAERTARAKLEREEAEAIAKQVKLVELHTEVKVDPEGHMYGSVSALDVARMLQDKGVAVEKRNVALAHPIKELGIHHIHLKLNEGVAAEVLLKILPEGVSEEQFFGAIAEQQQVEGDPMYRDYYSS